MADVNGSGTGQPDEGMMASDASVTQAPLKTGSEGGVTASAAYAPGDRDRDQGVRDGDAGSTTDKVKSGASRLSHEATDRVRQFADDGKARASGALRDIAKLLQEAADQVDEKLGAHYGDYARSAADTVQGFSSNVDDKSVDDLLADARSLIQKSPAVAIGTAAAIGFAVARLAKSGVAASDKTA